MIRRWTLIVALIAMYPGVLIATSSGACAQPGEVRVVVTSPDGETTFCVDGAEHGLAALRATGLEVVSKDFGPGLGSAVCSIDDVGNSLGDCPGAGGHWHFWIYADGRWVEAQRGADSEPAPAGAVHGWVWTVGSENPPPGDPNGPCATAADAESSDGTVPWLWIVVSAVAVLAVAAAVGAGRAR